MYYWDFVYGNQYLGGKFANGWIKSPSSWKLFQCPEDKTVVSYRRSYAMIKNLFIPLTDGTTLVKGSAYKQPSRTYAIAILVEHGASGGKTCAPLAARFFTEWLGEKTEQ